MGFNFRYKDVFMYYKSFKRPEFTLMITLMLLACSLRSIAGDWPAFFTLDEARTLNADREVVEGIQQTLLISPKQETSMADPRDATLYNASCHVYIKENGLYVCRFVVHTPDRDGLPLARRAGRFYALLWQCANKHLGTLCARLRKTPLDVWMTSSGEAGGEQFRSSIYIYNYILERSGIEWARELAHEYGHYLLPGASGYDDPENWGNGVLGERLFLKWMGEEMENGKIKTEDTPFIKPTDMLEYRRRQITPLISRILQSGPDPELLKQNTRRAMDAFTGLVLYLDEVWGSSVLVNLPIYLPPGESAKAHGDDFLNAMLLWVDNCLAFSLHLPEEGGMVYVPRGIYIVTSDGIKSSLTLNRSAVVTRISDGWKISCPSPAWRKLVGPTVTRWQKVEKPLP